MSIKQSVTSILLLLSFSFSAYAKLIQIGNAPVTNLISGTVMTIEAVKASVIGSCVVDRGQSRLWTAFVKDNGSYLHFRYNYYRDASCTRLKGSSSGYISYSSAGSCPVGTMLTPSGTCETICISKSGDSIGILLFPVGTPTVPLAC
ncbi:hypothetical protein, partial [Candidatus Enterovibrio escicola]|uniref:hypothetical protein n=1 Tax=Candidatus Enterovibrio escicola TaxID=1927127 RepID=UPI00167FE84C